MAVQHALVVRPIHLAGHIQPITTNYMPNVSVTLCSPHAIVMVHPLQQLEIHLRMCYQLQRNLCDLAKACARDIMTYGRSLRRVVNRVSPVMVHPFKIRDLKGVWIAARIYGY